MRRNLAASEGLRPRAAAEAGTWAVRLVPAVVFRSGQVLRVVGVRLGHRRALAGRHALPVVHSQGLVAFAERAADLDRVELARLGQRLLAHIAPIGRAPLPGARGPGAVGVGTGAAARYLRNGWGVRAEIASLLGGREASRRG
jgi:hypothetical protein